MKPKFRSLVASFAPLSNTSMIVCSIVALSALAKAADGTWTSVTTAGTWSNTANWSGGVVADGSGFTADLSTADLPAGAFAVALDTNRTIKSINFGDFDAVTTAGTWSVTGTTTLTLDGTTPTITAGVATTINPVIAGTVGMTKAGSANLILTNANTITSGITVTAGQITTKNGAALGVGALTLGNGTTFRYERTTGNASTFVGNAITVSPSSSVTITTDNAANGYSGVITGDAASTVTIGATGATAQCSFGANANVQQFSGVGTAKIFDGTSIRFSATSGVNNGGVNTSFEVGVGADITTRNSGTVNLGSLTGVGTITGSGGANGTAIFSVGAKGLDSVYGGVIRDAATGTRFAALTKVGAGKLTLTGSSTYTGVTNLNVGTLEIGDGVATTGSIGATNVNVAASSNLILNPGTGQSQSVTGIVAGAGNIVKKGPGRTSLTGVNTFTVGADVQGGILAVNADSGLGALANGVSFSTGSGSLASDASGVTTARSISIGAGATGGFAAIDATDSLEVTGVVSGSGGLQISGLGVVRLTGANTYLGNTTITSGTLDIGGANVTSSGSLTATGGNLGGSGSVAGAVTIGSGAGIKPGALTATPTSAVGTLTTGTLTLSGGSTLYTEFTNASTYDKVVVNGDVLTSGASLATPILVDLRLENSVAKFTTLGTYNLIQYSGTFTGNANDLFEVTAGSVQSGLVYTFGSSGGFITLTVAGAPPSEWNVDVAGTWSTGGNWLNGVPNASGANAIFGTVITAPRIVTLDSAKTVGAILFNNANQYTIGGSAILSLTTATGNTQITVLAGSHVISAPLSLTNSLDLALATALNSLTLSGNITGTGGLNNPTAGTVILGGSNTFSGLVNFSGGILSFANGSLGTGNLSLSNSTLQWAAGNTQDISSKVITIGGSSVTFDSNGNDVTLSNAIGNGGAGGLVKIGSGKITLAGNQTYAGNTTVSGGVLQLGNGGASGAVSGPITNNSELDIKLVTGSTFSNVVTGTGSLVHTGPGTLALGAQNTYSGTTSISNPSGVLVLTDTLNIPNSTLDYLSTGGSVSFGSLTAVTLGGLSGDKSLVLENTTPAALALTIGGNGLPTLYSGALSGSGALIKTGAGNTTLTGLNTFTGSTTVNNGTLELADSGAISSSTVAVAGNATLLLSGSSSSLTASGLCTVNNAGTVFPVLYLTSGVANLNAGIQGLGNANNGYRIQVDGGTLNTTSIALGRGALAFTTEGAAVGNAGTGLYVNGGIVNLSSTLDMGSTAGANSSVSTLVNGGALNVAGKVTIGLNNGGRWSVLQVSGGEFNSADTVDGVVVGGPQVGNAVFAITGGVAKVERIQFGQGALAGSSVVRITGGELDLGTGGINQGSVNNLSEFRLAGGTLGAKATWNTSFPINVAAPSVINGADALGVPADITLNGALTGIGGITKTGTGTVTLTGGNSYTGNTAVMAGVLSVTTKTFDDVAEMSIAAGATLNLNFSGGDRVGFLILDGISQPDGIYGKVGTGIPGVTETSSITGDGLLYVNTEVVTSPYAAWATTNITAINPTADATPSGDPDNDGIKNILEFVLGGNPLSSSTSVVPSLTVNATNFVFTFNRSDASEAEAALQFQWGTALATWPNTVAVGAVSSGPDANGVTVTVDEGTPTSNPDVVTVTVPRTNAVAGKIFGRLQAVK